MLWNHIKTAGRNLTKNKTSSMVNVGGLAVGMAVAFLIGLWIHDELSFNRHFANYDRIAQVMVRHIDLGQVDVNKALPIPLATALRLDYGADFQYMAMSTRTEDAVISTGEKTVTAPGRYMQPDAQSMFSLNMVKGGRSSGLRDLHSILLSESLSRTLFGITEPVGQTLRMDGKTDVQVTGVYRDFPDNTDFSGLRFILPWDLLISGNSHYQKRTTDWMDNFLILYVGLNPAADLNKVSAKIKNIKLNHERPEQAKDHPAVFLQPMSRWHLYNQFENGVTITSQPLRFVRLFTAIGIFVLLLACINFMNLSTARAEKRAKEVGVRKTLGSLRTQLIAQFFAESILTAVFALLIALGMVLLLLPWFNSTAGKHLSLPWESTWFWLLSAGFTLITGIIAGSYPALYLSSFQPVRVLKGTFKAGRQASIPRKVLVVIQFTVSITILIGTVIVFRQIGFSKDRPVGYDRDRLLYINMKTDDIAKQFAAFRDDVTATGAVAGVAESNGTVNELWSNNGGFSWKGKDPAVLDKIYFGTIGVSSGFGETVGWKFLAGRDFSDRLSGDSNAFVINEAAAAYMGLKNPVGEIIQRDGKNYSIIGVIQDVLMESPYQSVSPTVFFLGTWDHATVSIKINPGMKITDALAAIEPVFRRYAPGMPFDYRWADEDYAAKFRAEERIGKLAGFFPRWPSSSAALACSALPPLSPASARGKWAYGRSWAPRSWMFGNCYLQIFSGWL